LNLGSEWELVHVALGRIQADLLITNCRIVNVYSAEIHPAQIAIKGGRIAAIREAFGHAAARTIDAGGALVAPAFVEWNDESHLTGGVPANCTTADQVVSQLRDGRIPVLGATRATIDVLRTLKASGIDFCRACIRFQAKSDGGEKGTKEKASFLAGALFPGLGPGELFAMTSLNPAILCGMDQCLGSVTPGREASMFMTADLNSMTPTLVMVEGQVVTGSSFPVRRV
jgi:adenine deaminase